VSAETISDALLCLRYPNISSLQVVFNLLEPEVAKELLPLSHQKGIAIIARVPLEEKIATLNVPPLTEEELERIALLSSS
jgi:aryl-alcohol dehydrogenase-like predicted oxidoreductase